MFWIGLGIGVIIGAVAIILISVMCISSRKNNNSIINTMATKPPNEPM